MPVHVGIPGNAINGVRYSFLQGVIGLPVKFDSVPMNNDCFVKSRHSRVGGNPGFM